MNPIIVDISWIAEYLIESNLVANTSIPKFVASRRLRRLWLKKAQQAKFQAPRSGPIAAAHPWAASSQLENGMKG
ncbi:MAG: hypothetical protein LBU32_15675 [Clostridiales bacterium]|jgi:hypothetical protein|nr:hypothetical protein [Clostridiales bacterium]